MAKKQLKVPRKVFANQAAFTEFVENEKEWMYNRIVEAIGVAFNSGKTKAFILEAKLEDSMSLFNVDSTNDEWEYSLSLALDYNTAKENYEKCSDILKLMKSIRAASENSETKSDKVDE